MIDLEAFSAVLFDLDGVLTSTAELHFEAWKATFDSVLAETPGANGARTFERDDYNRHVDGLPRDDGVRNFLASRGINLPEGSDADPASARTIRGIGRGKNDAVNRLITERGVQVYEGSIEFVRVVRRRGLNTAVVSSSRNTPTVLEAAGIADLFDVRVDGTVAADRGLPGKPAPDTFLAAAADRGSPPERCIVVEDALAGVQAGHAGAFGLVIGVDRVGQRDALAGAGADIVVEDLAELLEPS